MTAKRTSNLYQPLFTPARAGTTCKFMRVIQSSLDQAEVSPARSRVHDHEFFQDADRPTKKCREVQRLPTAYLLPIVGQTEIRHLRLKGSFAQNTSLPVAAQSKTIETRSYSLYL